MRKNSLERKRVAEFFSIAIMLVAVSVFGGEKIKSFSNSINTKGKNVNVEEQMTLQVDSETLKEVAEKYAYVEEVQGVEREALTKKISDIYDSDLDSITKEKALEALGEVNVYEDDLEYVASKKGDPKLNKPTITYNSSAKEYTINATGGLSATYIKDELPTMWICPYNGKVESIGGADGVVLSINNLTKVDKKNTSTGIIIKKGFGKFKNGSSRTSRTMVTNNDDRGVGYEVQDNIKYSNVKNYVFYCTYSYTFNASSIQCQAVYDKNFAAYSGSVKLGYSHTWDDTSVNSISLGVDSVSFGWDKSSDKWDAYSYSRAFTKGEQD